MKKIFFFLPLFFILFSLEAQNAFTFGIKYGFMKPNNINRTAYSYSYARQWLTTPMPYFGAMRGYELSWQHRGEKIGYEFVYGAIKEVNIATGPEPAGLTAYRKIKLRMGGLSSGITAKIIDKKHIEVVPSLDLDLYLFSVTTAYSNESTFAGATEDGVVSAVKFGNTFAVNISLFATKWIGINIRPYYQLPWGKANVEGLASYWASGSANQRDSVKNYGVSGSLIFQFGRDY